MFVSNWLIYLMGLIQGVKNLSTAVLIFGGIAIVTFGLFWVLGIAVDGEENSIEKSKLACKKSFIVVCVACAVFTVLPSNQTQNLMIVNSVVTQENLNFAGETVEEVVDYITDKVIDTKERLNELENSNGVQEPNEIENPDKE